MTNGQKFQNLYLIVISELTNQNVWKALFNCLAYMYTNACYSKTLILGQFW